MGNDWFKGATIVSIILIILGLVRLPDPTTLICSIGASAGAFILAYMWRND